MTVFNNGTLVYKADKPINTFSDVVDKYKDDFKPNPLDSFSTYTYSLEWFVANKKITRQFQDQEAILSKKIANDEWPGPTEEYVTIAKTGYTTEFNVTNLSVDSVGVGNSDHSKVAGTADKLEFTVTQVGNTSLADTLQTAITLCGYKSISDAVYFMKINFLGVESTDKGEVQRQLPQTKVMPFKIKDYNNVNSSTDARGTTTVLLGQVAADTAVMNKFISQIEFGFDYKFESGGGKPLTLIQTLTSFFTGLNEQIIKENPYLDKKMKNTYDFEFSKQFKDEFAASPVSKGDEKSMTLVNTNNARKIGASLPGQNIYSTVEEICLLADKMKKELTKDNAGYTKVLQITPKLLLKVDGFNPVKGTQAYDVVYFIDYQNQIVQQNMTDYFVKIKNNKENVLKIFDDGYVHKKYDYLFTGNNDQILNFEISLQAELVKVYLNPTDSWKTIDFSKNTAKGKKLSEKHRELLRKMAEEVKLAESVWKKHADAVEAKNKELKDMANDYAARIVEQLTPTYLESQARRKLSYEGEWGDLPFEQLMAELKVREPGTAAFAKNAGVIRVGSINAMTLWENYQKLKDAIKAAKVKADESSKAKTGKETEFAGLSADLQATTLQAEAKNNWALNYDGTNSGYESSTADIFKNLREKNTPNIILAEELGDDFMTTMTNDDFKTILLASSQNPVQFERLIYFDGTPDANLVSSSADTVNEILLNAQAKYMEAKNGELSMYHAQMTIKGDPFFIEGYMPPAAKKEIFGNGGTPLDISVPPFNVFLNGFPHIVLESGKARGTDINDNVITNSMILSLYAVKSIRSDFSGGLFTQTLSLVKNPSAEKFVNDQVPTVGPEELGDNVEFSALISAASEKAVLQARNVAFLLFEKNMSLDQVVKTIVADPNAVTQAYENHITKNSLYSHLPYITDADRERMRLEAEKGIVHKVKEVFSNSIAGIKSVWQNATETKEAGAPVIKDMEEVLVNTADTLGPNANNLTGTLGLHKAPLIDNMVRRNNADQFIKDTRVLTKFCSSGDTDACAEVLSSQDALLATIGITPEEKGTAAAVTKMNDYFNGVIAHSGTHADFVLSEEEVAAYQIAVGGELNITGHDQKRIQRIVKKATGERTPNIILEEIKASDYGPGLGATVSNAIIDGTDPLVNAPVEAVLINVPEYTWEEQKYKDQINYTNSNIDWKNTFWFKKQADDAVRENSGSKIERKLEIKAINGKTLTAGEAHDVAVLTAEINAQIDMSTVTSDDVAEATILSAASSGTLMAKMIQNGVSLDQIHATAHKEYMDAKIVNSVKINNLSDAGWANVVDSAAAIDYINDYANGSGVRADLTSAVNTQTLGEVLNTDVGTATQLTSKTSGYYFDYQKKIEDMKTLEQVELDIAKNFVKMPTVTTTAVRTIVTDGVKEYIPVTNPVSEIRINMQPILVMPLENASLNTLDVYLPSQRGDELLNKNVSVNEVAQLDQARKVYDLITTMDYHTDTVEVDDDYMNTKVVVKDYNNLPAITYVDSTGTSQTINNPSAYFGLYTNTFDDSNPAFMSDYITLKEKISDLFPSITVGQPVYPDDGKIDVDGLHIYMRESLFYIDKTRPPGSKIW